MSLPPPNGDTTDEGCLLLLKMIVQLLGADGIAPIVIEAGTNTGHSAQAMADAGAIVFTADPVDHGARGDFKRWPGFFEDMPQIRGVWDFAFLDASGPNADGSSGYHDNRLRWKHFQLLRKLNPRGIIAVHDTATPGWAGPHTEGEDVRPLILRACTYNWAIGKGLSVFVP